ncbi:MAG: cobyrinate a,c-diamide synthase [Pseudomonadota bacterium]|nr:cobyrinate a,c-diamide synthase [Pseudomonadota bacterium]
MTNRFLVSAVSKSAGKTAVSVGLAAALTGRGLRVATFKKGPDYIDPMWLSKASQRRCWNLDFFTMEPEEITTCFKGASHGADVAMVEGTKGLHDGVSVGGEDSNAALAKYLDLPVILVLDTRGMTRGVAPLILGTTRFDPEIPVAGVVLNFVGGQRHEGKLRDALSRYTDIPVVGAIPRDAAMVIQERHLGLTPVSEHVAAGQQVNRLAAMVEQYLDIAGILELTASTDGPADPVVTRVIPPLTDSLKIGIARDEAFGFYYPDDLTAFARAGVELVTVDLLHDNHLPAIDGLFIGGGFPESFISILAANRSMRQDVHDFVESGGPTYAECGGLMYLCRSLRWCDTCGDMAGVIPADVVIGARPVGRGYARFQPGDGHPWPGVEPREYAAHEFHHARVDALPENICWASRVTRGYGVDGKHDGIVYRNLLAGFLHQRHLAANPWVDRFVSFVRSCV